MSDIPVSQLIVNKLTKEQLLDAIDRGLIREDEVYVVTDPFYNPGNNISIANNTISFVNNSNYQTDTQVQTAITNATENLAEKSTTLSGYGIQDAYTKTETDNIVGGLQPEINSLNKLNADLVDDSNSANKFVTTTEKTTWNTKQDELVSGTNIKTINGESLLGNGDLTITTNRTFNQSWTTNSTFKALLDDVNNDQNAVIGMSYLGEVTCSDLPSGIHNAEALIEIMPSTVSPGKAIHATITSGNIKPNRWEYTYWANGHNVSGWISFQNEITTTNKLDADLVDDSNSTHKFVSTTEKNEWNAKQNALTQGNGIDITNNVISVDSSVISGASAGSTAVQPNDLATVATTGSFNSLTDQPFIPENAADVNALPDTTKYGYSLSVQDKDLTLSDQDGNTLSTQTIPWMKIRRIEDDND